MDIRKKTLPNTYNISMPGNQIKFNNANNYARKATTSETQNINNFMNVFGVAPKKTKTNYAPKQKKKEEVECKTPEKEKSIEKKINKTMDESNIEIKRHCKSPGKLKLMIFGKGKEDDKKKDNEENNIKRVNVNENVNVNVNKNEAGKNLLKRASRIYELKISEPFTEKISLLDGEGFTYDAEFQRKEYQIKIVFNNDMDSFNDIHFTSDYFNFSQYYINNVKYNSDTKNTLIKLKDYRSYKIQTKDDYFYKIIQFHPEERIEYFRYAFYYLGIQTQKEIKYPINGWNLYDPEKEFNRQKVPGSFCLSQINNNYKICETYPSTLFLPLQFDDPSIIKIASCRIKNRFPVLTYVYTYPRNDNSEIIQTFLFRSAQINSGSMFNNKKINDEIKYVNLITNICNCNDGFIFFDCRPYLTAKANSLKGAGVDDINQYENCKELLFGDIENIHAVRKALKKAIISIRASNSSINSGKIAVNSNNNKKFLSKFEDSHWLDYLSDILCGAALVTKKLLSKLNVICHCSDGWDRTSQVCSLVQIILDPYFRTFEGFAVLIEKEWVSFGHQFGIRNGCDWRNEKKKEKSPIFIQFLHTVYQIMVQYPNAFEFRENLLLFLSEEIYSNRFGTFLFNCEKELHDNLAKNTTISIWSDIFLNKEKYLNPFYKYNKEPLIIRGEVQYLCIWKEFFYKYIKIGLVKDSETGEEMNVYDKYEKMLFKEKKDIINLMNIIKNNGLEKQMENNDLYKIYKDYLNP